MKNTKFMWLKQKKNKEERNSTGLFGNSSSSTGEAMAAVLPPLFHIVPDPP
jgi:hypothetical protein